MEGSLDAQELSTRAALRMTLIDLELPAWNKKQKRDRLTGCSLTGVQDAFSCMTPSQKETMLDGLRRGAELVATKYALDLRIASPLLTTTIKPEGTLSLVAGGVSAGLHYAHAPYFIRRIRVSADDALAKMARAVGWTVSPEVGSDSLKTAHTWVIDFPVASGVTTTKADVSALDQLHEYLTFQKHYTQHNSSNTITVKSDEWPLIEGAISAAWDSFVGVSFLSYDGGTYKLAPYEEITEAQYEELLSKCAPFNPDVLTTYESTGESTLSEDADCSTGACPVR